MRTIRIGLAVLLAGVMGCSGDAVPTDVVPQFGKPVAPSDPVASWIIPAAGGSLTSVGGTTYQNGVCGVEAKIFATTAASNSGDAILNTANPQRADRKCAAYPRKVTLTYPDAATETATIFANLHEVQNTSFAIPVGATVLRALNVGAGARCGTLRFRTYKNDGTYLGADSVLVTRVNASTWDVATQAPPFNRAYCDNTGELYAMPLSFRVVSHTPLP